MNREPLLKLLEAVRAGTTSPSDALGELKDYPFRDVEGFARVDHARALTRGIPEVIYGEGKTASQIIAISREVMAKERTVLATRVDASKGAELCDAIPGGTYNATARTWLHLAGTWEDRGRGEVLVVCAGTSDLPVAEECAITLHALGHRTSRLTDVGVAGLHRILAERQRLQAAEVVVVVAGMEGALPSVVAGLCSRPVIAVPTSVGYGAAFGGVAALLGMLNACSSGITVVNIDNGFGAAFAASLINRRLDA